MKRALGSMAIAILFALGCSNKKGDPPPPVGSGTLPMAAPGATGALAAGRDTTPSRPALTPPSDPEEDEDPGGPLVPAPSSPDDGGMAL